ncbi:PREDICTED: probable G-protein coupled receptor 22 [Gekko japonicus]|uniref:Probable G-protein coupled receptor 22 n=1 Tax=Gekko japonicus TaxID=146911 RepID=A0ABM1KV57_GEKJA|nr:PREDICTED: probable G-protein coupled receptor 22 [Gekko japonicus]
MSQCAAQSGGEGAARNPTPSPDQGLCSRLHTPSAMESPMFDTVLETTDGVTPDPSWTLPFPLGFQVSLTGFLMLEIVLGVSSNLTVLVLYCLQAGLVDSVSNMVTMNLHVLDVLICVVCAPLTMVVVLVPPDRAATLLCCFHEACITFSSVATATNVLVISLDRYDISVRPAQRVLTPARAILLLAGVWVLSLAVFFIPFLEGEFGHADKWQNHTVLCVGPKEFHAELGTSYHLAIQIPTFFAAVAVMLVTYAKILQALNISIGSTFKRSQRRKTKKRKRRKSAEPSCSLASGGEVKRLSQPVPALPTPPPMGVQASVSVIIALRRAVKRHRDRRERQRRVFRMSLLIISTFFLCWAPLSVANLLILCRGPSPLLGKLRICFLAMAYGTTIFHPLLYAFTRQKLRNVLRSKLKKRVVSALQVDPAPGGTVIHNSWVEPPRKSCKGRSRGSDGAEHCLTEATKE